jgi:hypothetical protein
VYSSATDNSYFTYTYTKGYPVINLNPDTGANLSGKITLPAKDPNGEIIKGIGCLTSDYTSAATGRPSVSLGTKITHVFIHPESNY